MPPADRAIVTAAHWGARVDRLGRRPAGLVAEVGHQHQQAKQHGGCRQQDGQHLREMNSELGHVSFPSPRPVARLERLATGSRELRLKACPDGAIRFEPPPGIDAQECS